MEKTLKNKKIFLYNRKESKFRQKLLTFLFFLVLATIFWLLSALDHNYSTNITFPIKYIHHLSDKEMVGDIPSEITINVSGHGYTLLGSIVTSKNHPLVMQVISLSFLSLRSDSDIDFLLTKTLKEQFQRQIGNEVTVNYVSPDTLYYHFSPIVRKKVPIQANLDIEFAKQYMQGGNYILQPDSVIISGPAAIVDTIDVVQTIPEKIKKIDKSFSEELKLQPIEKVYLVKKKIRVIVPVEKYTESNLQIPIRCINIPDSLHIKTFPNSLKVDVLISLRNYNKLTPQNFSAVVDFKSINNNINNKLKVKILRQPAYVRIIGFSPRNVEYLIEK